MHSLAVEDKFEIASDDERKPQSWWTTRPGILTIVAGIMTALIGLIVALNQVGVFPRAPQPAPPRNAPQLTQPSPELSSSNKGISASQPAPTREAPQSSQRAHVLSEMAYEPTEAAQGPGSVEDNEVRSIASDESTIIRFTNSSNQTVDVFWVDFRGQEKYYFTLLPGQTRMQQTYVTHPWIIRNKNTNKELKKITETR